MLTSMGDVGLVHVSHRGNVVANVVEAARKITRDLAQVGEAVAQMRQTAVTAGQQLDFARQPWAIEVISSAEE